ncbi:hypothetical protein CBS9595_003177 [Malassezia furfur]|nr:hypothetical protein CBS9595_003177 [Malassezia furfur]
MSFHALAPPSPHRDEAMHDVAMYDSASGAKDKRSIRSRLSDQLQRVRGRSPSPQPRDHSEGTHADDASPSKRRSMNGLISRSIRRARSPSPRPSSRNSVVYDPNAPEYYVPELPNWQLYDGSDTQLGALVSHAPPRAAASLAPPPMSHHAPPPPPPKPSVEDAGRRAATEADILDEYAALPAEQAEAPPAPIEMRPPSSLRAAEAPHEHRTSISAAAFGRSAERASVVESVVESTTEVAAEATGAPLEPDESAAMAEADATVIDYAAVQERTNKYEPTVPSARPWNAYESDDEDDDDEAGAGRLYRRRRPEPIYGAPLPGMLERTDTTAAADHKQERLLNAVHKAPEGAGLTDLMNRVVQPGRQSWLRGIWPAEGTRSASASEYSQRTVSGASRASHDGVVFQGADASPSLYSSSSMDRSSDPGTRRASAASQRSASTVQPMERTATASSRASTRMSDDEREAFERKRRSMLEARRILEQEKRQGSADFRKLSAEAPPPVPSKDTPRVGAAQQDAWHAEQEAAWHAQREAEWQAQQAAEWHNEADATAYAQPEAAYAQPDAAWQAQQEAEWQAQQEAAWYAQQEAEWHAQQEAEWHAQQEAEWHAQQEAEWHAQQEAAWHAQQEAAWHAQHEGAAWPHDAPPTDAAHGAYADMAPVPDEADAAPPPAPRGTFGFRLFGKRKALPSAAQRPPAPPSPAPASLPASTTQPLGSTVHSDAPAPVAPVGSVVENKVGAPPKIVPIPEPPTPMSLAETVIDEQGRRMKPDGFGGFVVADDTEVVDDDGASATTPKAPHVESMQHDFTRKDDRPPPGVPSPAQHFQHNLPGTSPSKRASPLPPPSPAPMLRPRAPAPAPRAEPEVVQDPRMSLRAPKAPTAGATEPFQVAAEVYTTPANLQGSVGRMTWTPEMAEAAAKYIQSMTASASTLSTTPAAAEAAPVPAVRPATELTVPAGMAPSRSVVEQLQARGVDLVLEAGAGIDVNEMPVQQALHEMMVRFYLYEKHSVPILKELDKRLVALEHWSLLDRQLEARPPAWNEEAVARITSEVRREMRGLMAGIKELHECRLELQSLTHVQTQPVHKRKRPTSMRAPDKRQASESNSVRTASGSSASSAYSAGSNRSAGSGSASDSTLRTPKPAEQPNVQPASLMPTSPLASLAGLGPRPYSPVPMQRAALEAAELEAAALEASAAQAAAENRPKVATLLEELARERYAETHATGDTDEAKDAKADDKQEAKEAQEAQDKPPAESQAEPQAAPTATAGSAPLRVPVATKPRYSDGAAESGLLQALMRANERAHTPPPPSTPRAHDAPEPMDQESDKAAAPAEAPQEAPDAPKDAPAAPTEAPQEAPDAPPARAPMASIGNVQSSTSLPPSSLPKLSTHASSSALRARAQRYLRNSASVADVKANVPAAAPRTSDADGAENAAPGKPQYQPSALSESLRRRMARFEPPS